MCWAWAGTMGSGYFWHMLSKKLGLVSQIVTCKTMFCVNLTLAAGNNMGLWEDCVYYFLDVLFLVCICYCQIWRWWGGGPRVWQCWQDWRMMRMGPRVWQCWQGWCEEDEDGNQSLAMLTRLVDDEGFKQETWPLGPSKCPQHKK